MNERLEASLIGTAGILIPALLIDHLTLHLASAAVIFGVAFASIVGYGYGAYSAYRDRRDDVRTGIVRVVESAWLIESTSKVYPRWLAPSGESSFRWTTNSAKALRFSRKSDAESVSNSITRKPEGLAVTEHVIPNTGMPAKESLGLEE